MQAKLETIRRLFEAINSGAIDTALEDLAEDVTWARPPDVPITGTLEGRARVAKMWHDFARPLTSFEIEPTKFDIQDDWVLAHVTFRGETKGGDSFEFSGAQCFRLDETGRVAEVREFRDVNQAQAVLDQK